MPDVQLAGNLGQLVVNWNTPTDPISASVGNVPFSSLFTMEAGLVEYEESTFDISFNPELGMTASGTAGEWTITLTAA